MLIPPYSCLVCNQTYHPKRTVYYNSFPLLWVSNSYFKEIDKVWNYFFQYFHYREIDACRSHNHNHSLTPHLLSSQYKSGWLLTQ